MEHLRIDNAQLQYALEQSETIVDDLAQLVMRLVHQLRKAEPDNELPDKALDYLKRNGLTGSILRDAFCRSDDRCQYAIDHGAEGLGHCPRGKCSMPDHGRWVARAVERAHGIKTSHNLCLSCGHSIDAHDRQYGCAEDGCDCETPN